MTTTAPAARSLADIIRAVQAHPDLADSRRRDLLSAVHRIAVLLDSPPEQLPAALEELRPRLNRILPVAHGLSRKTWHNLRSNLMAALKAAAPVSVSRRTSPSPAWRRLRDMLPDKRMQNGLTRFISYCDRAGIPPGAVSGEVANRFAQELIAGTLVANPRDAHRRTCRLWNEATALPGWPQIHLPVPDYRKPSTTVPLAILPETLRQDLASYLDWLAGHDLLADDPPPTRCKPTTITLRRRQLMLAVSVLINAGHPADQLQRLADLVSLDTFKAILRHYLPAGEPVSAFTRGLATALIAVAQHWVKVGPNQLAALKKTRARLGRTPSGLTEKNRGTLRDLADPAVRRRLLALPERLLSEARSERLTPPRAATCCQLSLAIDILLHAPIRLNNLIGLRLDANLTRAAGGQGLWHIVLGGAEVKNRQPQEYELSADTTRRLDLYLRQFRPSLEPGASPFLFIVQGGGQKSPTTLFQQLTEVIQTHVGVRMTPHQFRHFAAKLLLEHSPGAFAAASQLLGHQNIKTTVIFYAGIDTLTAGRHFDAIVAAEQARTRSSVDRKTRRGRPAGASARRSA